MEKHILLLPKVGDGFANSQLQFRIIISTEFLTFKVNVEEQLYFTVRWREYREEGSVKRFLEEQFVCALQFPLPSHPKGELVMVLHPCPPAQRGPSLGPGRLAIVSHSCKTQRTAPALAYNLKAVATNRGECIGICHIHRVDRDDKCVNVSQDQMWAIRKTVSVALPLVYSYGCLEVWRDLGTRS